jgi:hypothetical protein
VQVVEAPEFTLVGLHARVETNTGATKLNTALCEAPFRLTVTVALWELLTVPAVAVNVVELALAGTVTDAGMVSKALLSESVTTDPPAGAAWFRVTVQVVEPPEFTLVGLHARLETSTGATRFTVAVLTPPFRVATTLTLWFVVNVPAVAMKLAPLDAAGTVIDEGIVNRGLLSESATLAPPMGAAWFSVTEQVVEAPAGMLVGVQLNDAKTREEMIVTVPLLPVVDIAIPVAELLSVLVTLIEVPIVVGDIVAVRTATTPS